MIKPCNIEIFKPLYLTYVKLMLDAIYEFLCENKLLTPKQSRFHPGDSTINQLLSVTHKISSAFEEFPSRETRVVFLDISKAFDKVCPP